MPLKKSRGWDAILPNGMTDAAYAEKLRGNPADPSHTYEEISERFAEFGIKRNDNTIRHYFKQKGMTNPYPAQAARGPGPRGVHSFTHPYAGRGSLATPAALLRPAPAVASGYIQLDSEELRNAQVTVHYQGDGSITGTTGYVDLAGQPLHFAPAGFVGRLPDADPMHYGPDSVPLPDAEYDPENDPKYIQQLVEEQRRKHHEQRETRLRAQWIKRQSLIDEFVAGVRESIVPIEYEPYVPHLYTNRVTGNQAAVLYLSDAHIGKLTESFNIAVVKDRLNQIVNYVRESVRRQRMTKCVDELHIIFGGDIVDGANIFPTQTYHSEQNVKNQIFRSGVPYFAELIRDLATDFAKVSITTVPGNHGRGGKFAHEEDNADNYFYHALLLSCINLENVEWDICTHWYKQYRVLNTNILLVHGHQHMSQQGVPYYSITRMAMKWEQTMPEPFTVEIMGHFHTPAELDVSGITVIMNGSMVTGDEYALEKMGAQSAPAQTFLFIDEQHGLVERQLIHLH